MTRSVPLRRLLLISAPLAVAGFLIGCSSPADLQYSTEPVIVYDAPPASVSPSQPIAQWLDEPNSILVWTYDSETIQCSLDVDRVWLDDVDTVHVDMKEIPKPCSAMFALHQVSVDLPPSMRDVDRDVEVLVSHPDGTTYETQVEGVVQGR